MDEARGLVHRTDQDQVQQTVLTRMSVHPETNFFYFFLFFLEVDDKSI